MKEQRAIKSIKLSNNVLLNSVVDLVKSGRQVKINISGSSMQPFLYDGDLVILGGIQFCEIRLGHIILGRYNNGYVLHRVIEKKKDCVFIAGDNNISQIEKITANEIHAIAVAVVRADHKRSLMTRICRIRGMAWFHLRPFRRIYTKLFN